MPVLINDPELERQFRAAREKQFPENRDEVWEGVLVVPPSANNEHQRLVRTLMTAFTGAVDWDRGDDVLPGGNVSDRKKGWEFNYRIPDVLVVLAGGAAKDGGTHWYGGPDIVVEITSKGEDPRLKLDFYAKVGSRELLVVDRHPWAVELYRIRGKKMVPVARSDATNPVVVASKVLPLTYQFREGKPRPVVVITHTGTGQTWTA